MSKKYISDTDLEKMHEYFAMRREQRQLKHNKRVLKAILILGGVTVVSSILASKSSEVVKKDANRAMIAFGNETYIFEINEYVISEKDKENIKLKLKDGTDLNVNLNNMLLYNEDSNNSIKNIEDNAINISSSFSESIEVEGYDRALVTNGDDVNILEISDFNKLSESVMELRLTDGTIMTVKVEETTLFNSKSYMMEEAQENLVNKDLMRLHVYE